MKKAGTILKLAAPNYVQAQPEALRNDMIKTMNVLLNAAEDFNEAMSANTADTNLSPEGRTAAGVRVAASALATLDAVKATTIATLEARAASIEQSLRAKVAHAAPKDAAHEAQLREIRDSLRGLSASERLNVYRGSSDPLVLQAIETAPMTLSANRNRLEPFIDPAEQAAAVMARAEAADPASATTLREVRSLSECYRLAVGSVRTEILKEVPDAAGTPVPTIV